MQRQTHCFLIGITGIKTTCHLRRTTWHVRATTCHLKKATSRERLSSTACSFYSVCHRYKIPRPGLKGIYVQNSLVKWKRMFSKSCCAICSTYPESARNTSRPSRSLAMYWYLRFLNASSSASSSLSIQQAL